MNFWFTQIPYNNNRLDATTSSRTWQNKKNHSISQQSYKFKQKLNIHQNEENETNTSTKQARDIEKTVKAEGLKQIKPNPENKKSAWKIPTVKSKR